MKFELDDVVIDSLVQKQLFEQYTMLKDGFLNDAKRIPMYSMDEELNLELEFNLINALRLVHNYFALDKDRIKW